MASIAFFPFEFLGIPSVQCAFTSRRGGVSEPPHDSANLSFEVGDDDHAVRQNRRMLFKRFELTAWCECRQVHGDTLHVEPSPIAPEDMATLEGDGLATALPGTGLVIKTADCQPILMAHRSGRYVAGLHVGWRGNKLNFPKTGVRRFCETYGLDPKDIFAVRGPSLSPASAEFINFETDFGPAFAPYFDPDSKHMDLWRLTRDQLMDAGLPSEHIHSMDLCTMGRDDTFFSHRKACASPAGTTGRQAGFIWIKP
ncbi:polyphenol oxidase family protein [Pseudodesulfovibrio piezophilus]|uniref:Laccase domain-containing protein n=1 Tax=Pseudodesulfovibrio piezophilus (strain DSM 21447 / JCM 15486 / C1TLV30) TaxID=1322246 RepID=M1WKC9_PSEP2|nr:polyphenol oxidase family protein [Pseudodesulfovibrio piezophilus]CCH49381.1 conserved protein of unknown function [Pseudodesulfovibrio piezophilus C1TLV30]